MKNKQQVNKDIYMWNQARTETYQTNKIKKQKHKSLDQGFRARECVHMNKARLHIHALTVTQKARTQLHKNLKSSKLTCLKQRNKENLN